ncbi:MAG: NAD(P)-dependent oxidoreductase [Planctomycetaceae bacterium]|nr:NAD(P)-dependent oxidoreductase [Planctomycetaceae bacterium]
MNHNDVPQNADELDEWLSRPTDGVRETLAGLDGDIMVLGAAGKMGPTLARMARRALPNARRVYAVSRFSSAATQETLNRHGVDTIRCDLLDRNAVAQLPDAGNVIFMAGQKFGTADRPDLTWMMNAVVPAIAAERYRNSRIVVFSTGCVYPLVDVSSSGATEELPLNPPGEYAASCVARERVFSYFSREFGTRVLLFRLNYAIDLRYGVLHDVARKVWTGTPVDVSMGHVNLIWQGDANARALQCLSHVSSPAAVLNVTGPERLSVRELALRFGELLGRDPVIVGNETSTAWLSSAARSCELFGEPTVSLDRMMTAVAEWLKHGGASLNKPTHFESRNGSF